MGAAHAAVRRFNTVKGMLRVQLSTYESKINALLAGCIMCTLSVVLLIIWLGVVPVLSDFANTPPANKKQLVRSLFSFSATAHFTPAPPCLSPSCVLFLPALETLMRARLD
jgi:hypothetical protein